MRSILQGDIDFMKENFDLQFFPKVLDKITSNIRVMNVETNEILYMNDCCKQTFHEESPEGKKCWEVLQKDKKQKCEFCKIDELKKQGVGKTYFWKECNTITGKVYLTEDTLEKVGETLYHIQSAIDITDYIKLCEVAATDELTGILNRKAGKEKLAQILENLKKDEKFTAVLYDIDGLKWVNDTYGHLEGDRLLTYVAQKIEQELSESDFVFRLSGDEFIIIFMNQNADTADVWMKRILKLLKDGREAVGIDYDVTFSYGLATIREQERLTVSDVLSLVDAQMYIQKRDYHIFKAQRQLEERHRKVNEITPFQYNKEYLFDALDESIDDYVFVGNLKTGKFKYSYKMMLDFGLPSQVLDNAAAFWGKKIHPEDMEMFLRSNQEIADGRADRHTIIYRAKNVKGEWVHLMCKGRMVRDAEGIPDLFSGIIRNLDKKELDINEEIRVISDSSSDGIFKASMTEGFPVLYANDGYYELHGYTKKQMAEELNNCVDGLVYEEDRERITHEIADGIAENKRRIILEYRICRRDGRLAWVHVNAGILIDSDGTPIMLGMIMDITKRRELEEKLMRTEQLFKIARKNIRLNIWEYDIRKKKIIQTEESQKVHGYGRIIENVPETLIADGGIHPNDVEAAKKFYKEIEEGNAVNSIVVRIRAENNTYRWEKVTYTTVQWLKGKPTWAIGISEDITAQKEAEARVFKEERLRELLSEDMICSFQVNLSQNRLENFWDCLNGKGEVKVPEQGYEGVYRRMLDTIANEDDRKRFVEMCEPQKMQPELLKGQQSFNLEFRQKQKSGLILWVGLNLRVMRSPESGECFLFGYLKNIDLLKRRELSLKQKAETDEISGFYNLKTAKLLIEESLKKSQKEKCACVLFDVDNFKKINQEGGFFSGDKVLKAISSEITKHTLLSCIKARVKGDTFLLFFYNLNKDSSIREIMERTRENISRKYNIEGQEFYATVSAGMTMNFADNMSYEQMYQCAEYALQAAKREGKSTLRMFRDVEQIENGKDIHITVNPDTYEITGMNATGKVAFDRKGLPDANVKCHELLYNSPTPCSFCYKEMNLNEEQVWKCFLPRLNKPMYVQIKDLMEDGKRVRKIHLQEKMEENQETDSLLVLHLLKESYKQLERGEDRSSVIFTLMKYIANAFQASYAALYEQEETGENLRVEQSWKSEDFSGREYFNLESDKLENLFGTVFPKDTIFIKNKDSIGYAEAQEIYGEERVPLPLILTGNFKEGKLISMVALEYAREEKLSFEILEAVAEFLHQTGSVFKLRKKYEAAMQYDQKTGILNYQSYMEYLERINEDIHSTFGIFGIQIAALKDYNTRYGTSAGDDLLKTAADVLAEFFGRENCFRVSSARFFAVYPNITYENFQQRCEKVRECLEKRHSGMFADARVWGEQVISVEKLQQQVEEKLQIALTKLRILQLENSQDTVSDNLAKLKETIESGKFRTFFQPKANVQTGEICGAEALIRYYDEKSGIVPPGRFLPQIEKAGFIRLIDLFILKDVCRILKKWIACGWKPFPISLNYSRATILEPGILEETNAIMESMGVPKELIQIEVTETIGCIDTGSLKEIVERFTEAGYKIALDDFGAEYSNIYVLYSLELDALKLDRRIVSDIYHDKRARFVVENVIHICKELQIECVAEGVETEEHLGVLKEMNCDVMQGYLLNKPLPEKEFEKLYIRKDM